MTINKSRVAANYALAAALLLALMPSAFAEGEKATTLPDVPVKGCRGSLAKLYDECNSQTELFQRARKIAKAERKTLIVSFGAEWCIWCHVFDAYVRGEFGAFSHTFSNPSDRARTSATIYERANRDAAGDAAHLARFFADNFVLVHIEDRYAKDGYEVLVATGADAEFDGALPFIFTVDNTGRYGAALVSERVETRRDTADWFRGYDRKKLEQELSRMKREAE